MTKSSILFVCNGNIHRSVIAALSTRKLLDQRGLAERWDVSSRGLQGTGGTNPPRHRNLFEYPTEWALTGPALGEIGVEIPSSQSATPITREDVEQAALVLAMDDLVLHERPNSLIRQFPEYASKMRLFSEIGGRTEDVPDPAGSTDATLHRNVVHTINDTLRKHLDDMLHLAANVS